MSPFEVPEGPYTIEKIMESIRVQVVEPAKAMPVLPASTNGTAGAGAPDAAFDATRPIISDGGPVSRLLAQLELLRQRQGLDPNYRIRSHRPFMGSLLNALKRLIHWGARPYVDAIRIRQEAYNEAVLQALREVSMQFENNIRRLDDHKVYIQSFHKAIHDLQHADAELARWMNAFELRIQELAGRLGGHDQQFLSIGDSFQEHARRLDTLFDRYNLQPLAGLVSGASRLEALDRSRGTYEDIRCRQYPYLAYFEGAPGQVLDVGCGRGEMLHMLRIHGIECWGAETDPQLAQFCRDDGLCVQDQDALTALASAAPGSLGGIFAAQIIEHFFPGELVRFIALARRKVARGGRILLETLNPGSLGVLAKSYWNDLDHKQMIPPGYLKAMLELAGFEEVEIHYLSPFSVEERLPDLPPAEALGLAGPARQALQDRLDRLNQLLFGMQDYYLIARQGEPAPPEAEVPPA